MFLNCLFKETIGSLSKFPKWHQAGLGGSHEYRPGLAPGVRNLVTPGVYLSRSTALRKQTPDQTLVLLSDPGVF